MSYTALYRKFRPDTFEDVRGQDHIVKTLRNQITAERIGHAYLFCGTRGTGKTSVAKIFARAVNCEHPQDGNPCGECASCRAIAAGASMNVIEIDAASNNGVDNIREIREEVAYSPANGKYKVYIIDEVHMLSIGAFNALLKTLEEPPSYVIFILATTEANKIPVTILSRCQRYDFRRISQDTIYERLRELADREQVEAEDRALRYIARKGDGSLRDALSLLDQCIAFYLGETLTYDRALEVLGAVDTEVFSDFLRKIIKGDLVSVIGALEQLIMQGRDLTQLVSDFTWYLRNLMLLKSSDEMEDVLDVSTENLQQLREEAGMVRSDTLMRFIRIFSELSGSIRFAANKRVQVEMALIRLCRPESERDEISLVERIRRLEWKLEQLTAAGAVVAGGMMPGGGIGMTGGVMPGGGNGMAGGVMSGGGVGMASGVMPGNGNGMAGGVIPGAGNGMAGGVMPGGGAGMAGGMVPGSGSGMASGMMPGGGNGMAGGVIPGVGNGVAGGMMPGGGTGMTAAPYFRMAPEDLQQVKSMWRSIVAETSGMFRVVLSAAEPKFNAQDAQDGRLYVVFADFLAERYLDSAERKAELEQIIADKTGKRIEVRFVLAADEGIQKGSLAAIDLEERIHEFIHTDIEIEDET